MGERESAGSKVSRARAIGPVPAVLRDSDAGVGWPMILMWHRLPADELGFHGKDAHATFWGAQEMPLRLGARLPIFGDFELPAPSAFSLQFPSRSQVALGNAHVCEAELLG